VFRFKIFFVKQIDVFSEEEKAVTWKHQCNQDARTGHPEIKVVTWRVKLGLL
jgi:hypothetical protein